MARDPVAEIQQVERALLAPERRVRRDPAATDAPAELTVEAVRRRREALLSSPFSFFRGTFHLMAHDLAQGRVERGEARAPEGLVVGDLHLENFGVYRGASGAFCFDVNDFDEVGWAPIDLDVKRLCTSALLLPSLPERARLAIARAAADAWADGLTRLGGRFPIAPFDREHADGVVRELLEEGASRRPRELVGKVTQGRRHDAFEQGPKLARPEKRWRSAVARTLVEYLDALDQLKARLPGDEWELLDVAYRFKGTGTLGRLRFDALIGRGEQRRILEFKEARPSALDEARGHASGTPRARVQTAAIRRLQGDPWPHVASTRLRSFSALGRELEPGEQKVSLERLARDGAPRPAELRSWARQCGEVLARLHARANAPLLLNARWSPREAARHAVEFAASYATQVRRDHAQLCATVSPEPAEVRP